jgi:hypothetical protein
LLNTIAPVRNIPGGFFIFAPPPPPTADDDDDVVEAHSPYNCIRTLTKSIGCVTAPEAIAPSDPLANPFHAAGGRGVVVVVVFGSFPPPILFFVFRAFCVT